MTTPCFFCHTPLNNTLFCFECQQIQPVQGTIDPFALLGISIAPQIDLSELERRYHQLATQLHPDFYSNNSSEIQEQSLQATASLNQAYQILQDEEQRHFYLFKHLLGSKKWDEKKLPSGFLQEVFFLQESLEEESESSEGHGSTHASDDLQQRLAFLERQIQNLWSQIDLQHPQELLMDGLQSQLNARRYLKRLQERTTTNLS